MPVSLSSTGQAPVAGAGRSAWLEPWLEALPAAAGALEAVQVRGRRALREQPLPSARQEDWRFTDLALLQQLPLAPIAAAACLELPAPEPGVLRLQLDGLQLPIDLRELEAWSRNPAAAQGELAKIRLLRGCQEVRTISFVNA